MNTPLDRQLMRYVTGAAPLGGEAFPQPAWPDPRGRDRGIGRVVLDGLVRLWRTIERVQQERATARALSALSDHSLHDIGVDRGYIPAVAHQAAAAHLAVSGLSWASVPVASASNDNPRHRAA